jgi:nucleoporin NUP42
MSGRAADTPPYPGLTVDAIERDLRAELPQWILSCYGPGRDAPEQLWGGYPREQSVEEIRLHFMMGAMAGNPQGAVGCPPFGVLPNSC